jgi:hypothetical protein
MATRTLIEKIDALPPEKRSRVETLVDELSHQEPEGMAPRWPTGLVERINAHREALLREHGYFDTLPIIQQLREHGGR